MATLISSISGKNVTLSPDDVLNTTNTYSTTGSQSFTIPSGINTMQVKLWGSGGGGGTNVPGGGGACVVKTITVTAGSVYYVTVGQAGASQAITGGGQGSNNGEGGSIGNQSGDYNGKGQGGQYTALHSFSGGNYTLLMCAGGGGGGDATSNAGGGGGGQNAPTTNIGKLGGSAGSGGVGGTGGSGSSTVTGASGSNYTGLTQSSLSSFSGNGGLAAWYAGGGGGGYGGGGAGCSSAGSPFYSSSGGGGGNYCPSGTIYNGNLQTPGNTTDPDYTGTVGRGGNNVSNGSNGYAVIKYYTYGSAITLPAPALIDGVEVSDFHDDYLSKVDQAVLTSSTPTFVGATLSGLTASSSVVTNGSKALASLAYSQTNTASSLAQRDGSGNLYATNLSGTNTGDMTMGTAGSTPNANAGSISSQVLTLQPASGSFPGIVSTTTQTFAGNKTFSNAISASNLSGTNTGDMTMAAVGSSPNANAGSISSQVLTLQPADGSNPGVVSTTTQIFAGNKTFSGSVGASNLSGTNTGDMTMGTAGSTPNSSGGSISSQVLTLQPADGSNPGIVSTTTQTFAGNKTFSGSVTTGALTITPLTTGVLHSSSTGAVTSSSVVFKDESDDVKNAPVAVPQMYYVNTTLAQSQTIRAIAWNTFTSTKLYIAAGQNNNTAYLSSSTDGISWTQRTSGSGGQNGDPVLTPYTVCVGNGTNKFLVVTCSNNLYTSADGITWSTYTQTGTWSGAIWISSTGTFIIAGASGAIGTSTTANTGTWSTQTVSTYDFREIAYSSTLGIYVFGASGGGSAAGVWSTNLSSFNAITSPASTMQSVCWSPDLAIFVGVGGFGQNGTVYSTDGKTWTAGTNTSSLNFMKVCWCDKLGLFLASGGNTFSAYVSADGRRFYPIGSQLPNNAGYACAWSTDLEQTLIGGSSSSIQYQVSIAAASNNVSSSLVVRDNNGAINTTTTNATSVATTNLSTQQITFPARTAGNITVNSGLTAFEFKAPSNSFTLSTPILTVNSTVGTLDNLSSLGTITITAVTTNPTKATTVAQDGITGYLQNDLVTFTYNYAQAAGTGGGAGSGDYLFAIPAGYTINTTIFPAFTGTTSSVTYMSSIIGIGFVTNGSTREYVSPTVYDSTHFRLLRTNTTTAVSSGAFPLNAAAGYWCKIQFNKV